MVWVVWDVSLDQNNDNCSDVSFFTLGTTIKEMHVLWVFNFGDIDITAKTHIGINILASLPGSKKKVRSEYLNTP